MVAGGVLLFIVSIELLTHGVWRFGVGTGREVGESGVVPLAFPLLAGPGAITSVMISFQTGGLIVTMLSISIVIVITYIILRLVNPIYRILGRRGSMIFTSHPNMWKAKMRMTTHCFRSTQKNRC